MTASVCLSDDAESCQMTMPATFSPANLKRLSPHANVDGRKTVYFSGAFDAKIYFLDFAFVFALRGILAHDFSTSGA